MILTVIDNGPEINHHHRDKIFQLGFTTKNQGQGMGLFNIKQILTKYSGDIQFRSEEGETIFEISLPLKEGVL